MECVSTGGSIRETFLKHLWRTYTQPHRHLLGRPLLIVWTLYAATYATANATESLATRVFEAADRAILGTPVTLCTFFVNTPLSLWNDVRFSQFFGSPTTQSTAGTNPGHSRSSTASSPLSSISAQPRRMPTSVYAAFLTRDIITVFGSFALAPQVSVLIPDSWSSDPTTKASMTQLVVPAMTQLAATPLHLLALDLYSLPGSLSGERLARMRERWLSTTAMRSFRLIPAFGLGCIANTRMKSYFHERWTRESKIM